MRETWQKVLRSRSWLSEVGNINARPWQEGCKGKGLNAYGNHVALTTGQPSSCPLGAQGRVYVAPTRPAVATRRQQDEGSGLPEHAHAWLTQPCLCFPTQQKKAGMFPCPTQLLGRLQSLPSGRDHKSEALFWRGVYHKRPAIHVPLSLPLTVTLWIEVRSL